MPSKPKPAQISKKIEGIDNKDLLLYGLITVTWSLYFFMRMQTPLDLPYDLDANTRHILRAAISIPYLIFWLLGAYAFVKISSYANKIKGWEEERSFRAISYGILMLLAAVITPTGLSMLASYFAISGLHLSVMEIIIAYLRVFPYLAAFILFYVGVRRLNDYSKVEIDYIKLILFLSPLIAIAYLWLEIIFSSEINTGAFSSLGHSLVILTIVIPSLAGWTIGMMSVFNFRTYLRQAGGVIYENALKAFILGITAMIISSVSLQAIASIGTEWLMDFDLVQVFAIVYSVFVIQGFGYGFMAKGAKKLTRIETV